MDTTIKTCTTLENIPAIPQEVLEKNKVTDIEIIQALAELERRRMEDNKPMTFKQWIKRTFTKGGSDE